MGQTGIIFDFNGTMFWDSKLHELAWRSTAKTISGREITDAEFETFIHGRTNDVILEYLLNKKLDDETKKNLSAQKEQIYRDMCEKKRNELTLAPGVVTLLEQLKSMDYPRIIATSSGKENVAFYMDLFDLAYYFGNNILYYDTSFPGKPAPDMYLRAASLIHKAPHECLVIEDAISGIASAKAAGIGKIIAISGDSDEASFNGVEGISGVIKDFTGFYDLYIK